LNIYNTSSLGKYFIFQTILNMPYELKTKLSDADVSDFLNTIEDIQKREDSFKLLDIFSRLSWEDAKMWWSAIIGFWTYHYQYASGQEWDWMRTGFSPRKTALTIYIMPGYQFDEMENLLSKLGKYKTGRSCLYIKKLADIDLQILEEIIKFGLDDMKKKYPTKN